MFKYLSRENVGLKLFIRIVSVSVHQYGWQHSCNLFQLVLTYTYLYSVQFKIQPFLSHNGLHNMVAYLSQHMWLLYIIQMCKPFLLARCIVSALSWHLLIHRMCTIRGGADAQLNWVCAGLKCNKTKLSCSCSWRWSAITAEICCVNVSFDN